MESVTGLLSRWRAGDSSAADQLAPLVYPELRRLAAAQLRREFAPDAIQATELVHEAFLRLMEQNQPAWKSRLHFYSVAAKLMRQVLVDRARLLQSEKRGSRLAHVVTDSLPSRGSTTLILRLSEALSELERMDARKALVLEQRHLFGLSAEEIADVHSVSPETVRRDLRIAEAWLRRYLRQ